MALTSVSCYYMTSFNYDGKKARDLDLTCRCDLSNNAQITWDQLAFGEVPTLERVLGFQSCDFIDGLLCSCMLHCFEGEMLWDLPIQPT